MKNRKSPRRLKVFFLTTSNAGTAYYRMFQFKEAMNRHGLASAVIPWFHLKQLTAQEWQWHVVDDPQVSARTGLIATMVAQADVIVVQYLHTIEALCLIEALKACHPEKVFLTEIDDYIHETPVDFECFDTYKPGNKYRIVVEEQLKALDGAIVSTPFLAEAYREFCPHIYVVPNAIDFKAWDKIPKVHSKEETRIGWAGAGNHAADLKTIEAPVKKFLEGSKGVSLHMLHGAPDEFKDKPKIVWHKHWVWMNKYPQRLAKLGFDIGLAPLQPNDFKRAKSNLRRLEYAALGIPVLGQNWGHLSQTVAHGKDGFLYNNEEEFSRYLELLVAKKELRLDMGRHNYLTAKRDFNLEAVTQHYVEVLKEAKARGQTTKVDVSERLERRRQWTAPQPAAS